MSWWCEQESDAGGEVRQRMNGGRGEEGAAELGSRGVREEAMTATGCERGQAGTVRRRGSA